MKRSVFGNVVFALLIVLMLAGEALTVATVVRLDMLPPLYMGAMIAVLAIFSLVIALLLFVKGKRSGKGRRVVGCILMLLLLCGCAVITTVATDVMNTLQATNEEEPAVPTREIYVLADNKAESLMQTGSFTYGFVKNFEESCVNQVLTEVQRQTGETVATAGYTNLFTMVNALFNNQIDAMILNGGYVGILEETEEFANFSAMTKILAQVEVEEPEEMLNPVFDSLYEEEFEDPEEVEETTEPIVIDLEEEIEDFSNLKPFVVYVSGSDTYGSKIVKTGRSDVNILAAVNPMTKQVVLINTPRDYYVQNTAGGGARDKLTHCGIYGMKCSMNTLGNLYEADIEYYVRINFDGFKKLIDAMGGVTVYSDYAFTAITRTKIKEGKNELNGQQALDFARERYTLKGGDNARGQNQMKVIKALIQKATSGTTIITNYSDIMASVDGMFQMNIPTELISDMMKMQLSDMAQWNIVTYATTGNGSMAECYSMPGMKLSVIKPSQSSVNKAIRLIDMVFAGELLTEEVVNSIT